MSQKNVHYAENKYTSGNTIQHASTLKEQQHRQDKEFKSKCYIWNQKQMIRTQWNNFSWIKIGTSYKDKSKKNNYRKKENKEKGNTGRTRWTASTCAGYLRKLYQYGLKKYKRR